MLLPAGTRLGPYEIVAPLGAGGMGEVYRARDTRLGREVAVKVLPIHLSANAEVRARFEREAKTVSGLNHPNICTLFDVGREGDTDYLVMELVEGETLAQRLHRGPLPAPELLRLGAQIADGLDRAHRAGVIHRDLKPGNIMITRSGAKLMDFGLARATGLAGPSGSGSQVSAMTQSPTVAQPLTSEGTIVGTFQYMSPEQLEGREADVRSDIWSLGCVLYEMATGRRAFEGRSQASLIAAILDRDPPPVEVPSGTPPTGHAPPPGIDRLIRACLAKDPEDRVQTAHSVKQQLQWIAEGAGLSGAGVATPVAPSASGRVRLPSSRLAWGIAAGMTLLTAAAFAWLWPRANAPHAVYRFRSEPPPGVSDYFWPRVSPDGRLLVFQATDSSGTQRAWVRPMDQSLARPIVGTEGVRRVYWSPDSREIAFVAGGKVQRLAVSGGTPIVVCEATRGVDLSWGSSGQILMDGRGPDSLMVVPARGGELRPATRIDRSAGELGSAWPCFLPDGKHFLFIGSRADFGGNIRLGRLGSLDSKLLGTSDGRVEYAPGGWVLYLKGTTLLAQRLDLRAAKLVGQPLTLAENLRMGPAVGHFSVTPSGVLAYARDPVGSHHTLFEVDRKGVPVGKALTAGLLSYLAISPDGRRILLEKRLAEVDERAIWMLDLRRGTENRLTFGGAARTPEWSPDGRRFACVRPNASGPWTLLLGSADGLGGRDSIVMPGRTSMLTQWAPSGSRLIVVPGTFEGVLSAQPDSGDRMLHPIEGLSGTFVRATLSPDGRWIAYARLEGGAGPQVFVQSLVGAPGRWQVSTTGGFTPTWTRGGRELIYESRDALYAVDIDTQDGFHAGAPTRLFSQKTASTLDTRYWSCTEDGMRFFVLVPPKDAGPSPIEIVSDFASLVNRR